MAQGKPILKGFSQVPDVGSLKTDNGEYSFLQNVRGFGRLGAKRLGVQSRVVMESGIMGMHDLKIDDEPTSPDKIMIVTYDGSITIFDWSEFIVVFDYIFSTGFHLNLQAPNLKWYSVVPTSPTVGSWVLTEIAAPASTIATDFPLAANQLFGFQDASGIWRMHPRYLSGLAFPGVGATRYAAGIAVTTYTADRSFVTGVGPVFTDEKPTPQNWRLTVTNAPALMMTSV